MYDIYLSAGADRWRFTLGKSGRRKLLTIGLNPSTATRERSDPTASRVEQVAKRNGFDGFVMLNLYPVRATDFRELPHEADSSAFAANLEHVEAVVALEPGAILWAAWGEGILARGFFVEACAELVSRLEKRKVMWRCFGDLTVSGHPRHPSRLNYAWSFAPFDAASYVRALCAPDPSANGPVRLSECKPLRGDRRVRKEDVRMRMTE